MHKVGIYYNEKAFRDIMKSNEISNLEQDFMMKKLNEIQAAFLQEFGFQGAFEIKRVDTNSRRSRTTFRVIANDARTTAVLKRQSGWLARFL